MQKNSLQIELNKSTQANRACGQCLKKTSTSSGLLLRTSQQVCQRVVMSRPLTSSGSESLNSQPSPVQLMKDWQDLSVSSSRRNCHSWMGPLPEEQMGKEGTRGRRGRGRKKSKQKLLSAIFKDGERRAHGSGQTEADQRNQTSPNAQQLHSLCIPPCLPCALCII